MRNQEMKRAGAGFFQVIFALIGLSMFICIGAEGADQGNIEKDPAGAIREVQTPGGSFHQMSPDEPGNEDDSKSEGISDHSQPIEKEPASVLAKSEEPQKRVISNNKTVYRQVSVPADGVDVTPMTYAELKKAIFRKFGIKCLNGNVSWTKRQLEEAYKVMSVLPERYVTCTKSVLRESGSAGLLGYVYMGVPQVHLLSAACNQKYFQGTLVHEMAHCFQANHPQITQTFSSIFWPGGMLRSRSVSQYGCTQPVEDMAESARAYVLEGPQMRYSNPSRYKFMKQYVFGNREFN